MELILTCNECGHHELGNQSRALMAKVRMLNHLNREHPEVVESFKDVVVEDKATADVFAD